MASEGSMVCTTRMESMEEIASERTLSGERKQLVFFEIQRDVRLLARRGVQNDGDFLVVGNRERAHADDRREERQGAQLEHVDGGLGASLLQNGEIFLAGGRSGMRHPADLVDFLGLREESEGQTPNIQSSSHTNGRRMSHTATALPSAMPQAAKTSAGERKKERRVLGFCGFQLMSLISNSVRMPSGQ